MWFRKKQKNRRLGRESVLDVKLRSSQVRAARARLAMVALGVVLAVVSGLYLAVQAGDWVLNRLVYENSAFGIEQIEVQTDGVLVVRQLQRWSGVKPGENLLALDLEKVRRDLTLVSRIESVSVERILPHTLRIRVHEREPVAQLNLPQPGANGGIEIGTLHLDAAGYVMLPLDPRHGAAPPSQPLEALPLIAGPKANDLQVGRRLDSFQVQAALQLIGAFERSPLSGRMDVKRIDLSTPEVLVVTTDQGSEITLGLTNLEGQLRRWQDIVEASQRLGKAVATLDLAVTNNIPARFLELSALPPGPPKPPKPVKKKHV